MVKRTRPAWLTEEVSQFLASSPSPEQLLTYRPSVRIIERHHALLEKSKESSLTADEEWELDQFEHIEMLMQAIKARLRPAKPVRV